MSFLKKLTKPVAKLVNHIPGGDILASIALTAAGQPELAALLKGTTTLGNGGSLGKALLSAGLSYGGSALGGNDTIFGNSLSGALKSGISGISDSVSGALDSFGNATGLGSLYSDASGALGDAYSSASDAIGSLYNGSGVQNVFNSGKDALNSIVGTSSAPLTNGASAGSGGGISSYGPNQPAAFNFGQDAVKGKAGDLLSNLGGDGLATEGASNVGNKYAAPLASIGIGSVTNQNAKAALLKSANANKALLSPYLNFDFQPGDLTQDPGYQFNLAQGNQALDRTQLARGGYFSGDALKEAQNFGQGLADNTYNSAFNRALQSNNAGLTGALATAGVNDSIGNIKASSAVNTGNLYSGALGDILGGNSYTNSGALKGGFDVQALLKQLGIG